MKKRITTRVAALLLCLALLVMLLPAVYAEQTASYFLCDRQGMRENAYLCIDAPAEEFLKTFRYGDIVTVTVAERSTDAPVCSGYDDVSIGAPLIMVKEGADHVRIAINFGKFGVEVGLLRQTETGFEPTVADISTIPVTVTMKQPEGYLAEWKALHLERTNDRADYAHLSDAEYANFRAVPFDVFKNHILYRSASPIDDSLNRNKCADEAARLAGVRTFLNLCNTEEEAKAYPGFTESYYSTQTVSYHKLSTMLISEDFLRDLMGVYRSMLTSETPYLVHCKEGKDRTGIFVSLLGLLCGEPMESVLSDYMTTYWNFFGVEPGTERCFLVLKQTEISVLSRVLGVEDLFAPDADIPAKAEAMFLKYGMTEDEINALRELLCGGKTAEFEDAAEGDWFYDAVRFAAPFLPGVTETKFDPSGAITAKAACEAFYQLLRGGNAAEDSTDPLTWALEKGLLPVGMDGAAALSRETLFTMLGHYLIASGQLAETAEKDALSAFTDGDTVSERCAGNVAALCKAGLVSGYADGTLRPAETATRAQTAVLLQRIAEYLKLKIG